MNESKSEFQLPGSAMEELAEADCLERLSVSHLGRIAFFARGRPEIFPVNYAFKSGTVVLRTAPGTKLSEAPGSHVAFEIDEYDPESGVGWSVIVHGRAREVTNEADDFSWAARGAHVTPLAPGEKSRRLAIEAEAVSGRRFRRMISEQYLG